MPQTSDDPAGHSPYTRLRSVLLCGASVRSLAESAIACGLHPLCVDFFEDADLTSLLSGGRGRFVGRIAAFGELPRVTHSVRGSIPMLWAGGLENETEVLREIAQRRPVIGMQPSVIAGLRDPELICQAFLKAGLNGPRIASPGTADPTIPWLRNSTRSAGGLAVSWFRCGANSVVGGGEYLQEYIDGVPMSAVLSVVDGEIVLHGTALQVIGWPALGASDFLFCGNAGPVEVGSKVQQQILAAAAALTRVTATVNRTGLHGGLNGVFGLDFVLRHGHVWVIECNPRIPASHGLYELTKPGMLLRRHVQAFGWEPSQRAPKPCRQLRAKHEVRLILWAGADMTITAEQLRRMHRVNSPALQIADLPVRPQRIAQRNPICSIIARGDSLREISARLDHFATKFTPPDGIHPARLGDQLQQLCERFQHHDVDVSGLLPDAARLAEHA